MKTVLNGLAATILIISASGPVRAADSNSQADPVDVDSLVYRAATGDRAARERLETLPVPSIPKPLQEDIRLFLTSKERPSDRDALIEHASSGDSFAQFLAGVIYEAGLGVAKDYSVSVDWFRKSALAGNPMGQFQLAQFYDTGTHVSQDRKLAFELYLKAAKQGMPQAEQVVGNFYQEGKFVGQDYQEALSWFKKSAAAGNSEAQNSLGYMHQEGLGIPVDLKAAFDWYQRSAQQENRGAAFNLGLMYVRGQGVRANRRVAIPLFEKAAEAGIVQAQFDLALIYEQGVDVPVDYAKAIQWYATCLANGDARCSDPLAVLRQAATTSQVATGESAAHSWMGRHPASSGRPATLTGQNSAGGIQAPSYPKPTQGTYISGGSPYSLQRGGMGVPDSSSVGQYLKAIQATVTAHWVRPLGLTKAPCIVHITQLPGGDVIEAEADQSCPYNTQQRQAAEDAIRQASPLPYKGFESVFQRRIDFTFGS